MCTGRRSRLLTVALRTYLTTGSPGCQLIRARRWGDFRIIGGRAWMPYRAPGWFTFPATTRVRGDDDHHRPISAAESSRRGIVVWCVEAGFFAFPMDPPA